MPTEENQNPQIFKILEKTKTRIKPSTVIISILVIAVFFATAFFASLPIPISEWIDVQSASSKSGKFPCDISAYGSAKDVRVCSEFYVVTTDSHIVTVNQKGAIVSTIAHGYADCVIKSSNNRFIVFNRKSGGYQIHNAVGLLFDGKLDEKIVTADIADDGTFAIVTDNNEVDVYNKNFEKIYNFQSATNSITCVDIASESGNLVIASVTTKNGKFQTTIQAYRTNNEEPVYKTEVDSLALEIRQMGSKLLVVGDTKCTVINTSGDLDQEHFDYGSYQLASVETHDDKVMIALADNKNSQTCTIHMLGSSLTSLISEQTKITTDKTMMSCGFDDSYIYVLSDKLYAYNYDGAIKKTYDIPVGASDFAAFDGDAVVIGYNSIDKLKN